MKLGCGDYKEKDCTWEEMTYPENKKSLEIGEEGVELSKEVFICCRAEENVVDVVLWVWVVEGSNAMGVSPM